MQTTPRSEPGGVLRSGWRRFFYALRPPPRRRSARHTAEETPPEIDPVALTIMAVDRLGPARLSAVFYGVPVTVAAPDRETAAIFRAALSQMAKARSTDRLISVELVAEASGRAKAPRPGQAG
jgi:hypothetical protein